MKKILICLLSLFLITGCSNNNNNNEIKDNNDNNEIKDNNDNEIVTDNIENNNEVTEVYKDDNPIKLSFYKYNGIYQNRTKMKEHLSSCIGIADIGSFEVFLTDIEEIDNDYYQNTWKTYYDTYENIDNYKIGYHLKFSLKDGTVFDKLLLDPDDGDEFYHYIQIYFYDDVNQKIGQWYTHVTPEEFNENTILSSIKLTASTGWEQIESPIELTVFSYDSDDDFLDNKYRGNSFYNINITCTK